jgi:ankyrin repeat protein
MDNELWALYHAVYEGDLRRVESLTEGGAHVNEVHCQTTPLINACKTGNRNIVQLLLHRCADVDFVINGATALSCALEPTSSAGILKDIVDAGARLQDINLDSSIRALISGGAVEKLDILLSMVSPASFNKDWVGTAAELSSHAAIVVLTEHGVMASSDDARCSSLLLAACSSGDTSMTAALLGAGTDSNVRDQRGRPALACAAIREDAETVALLLGAGAAMDAADDLGSTALVYAAQNGDAATAQLLLSASADIHHRNMHQNTALTLAAASGAAEVVALLLRARADPDAADTEGMSPLMLTVPGDALAAAEHLVTARADVDARSRYGDSALMLAVLYRSPGVTRLLLGAGADATSTGEDGQGLLAAADDAGMTPLMAGIDARAGEEVVAALLSAGAPVDAHDAGGRTALHLAASAGDEGVVRLLVCAPLQNYHERR